MLGGIDNRLDDIEEQISELKDRRVEITQTKQGKEKKTQQPQPSAVSAS